MSIFKTGLVTVGLAIALAGCGGDDDKKSGSACNAFAPCGGNLVGTWEVKDTCVQGKGTIEMCPTATTSFEGIHASGTMTFNADMTGSSSIVITGGLKLNVPASCTGGQSCSTVEGLLKAELVNDADAPFSGVACTGTDTCACTFTFKGTPMTAGGAYSTAGSVLTQGTDQSDYCVAGNELRLKSRTGIAGMGNSMMSMDDVTMSMVLTKK
jgi:hypothetical protein